MSKRHSSVATALAIISVISLLVGLAAFMGWLHAYKVISLPQKCAGIVDVIGKKSLGIITIVGCVLGILGLIKARSIKKAHTSQDKSQKSKTPYQRQPQSRRLQNRGKEISPQVTKASASPGLPVKRKEASHKKIQAAKQNPSLEKQPKPSGGERPLPTSKDFVKEGEGKFSEIIPSLYLADVEGVTTMRGEDREGVLEALAPHQIHCFSGDVGGQACGRPLSFSSDEAFLDSLFVIVKSIAENKEKGVVLFSAENDPSSYYAIIAYLVYHHKGLYSPEEIESRYLKNYGVRSKEEMPFFGKISYLELNRRFNKESGELYVGEQQYISDCERLYCSEKREGLPVNIPPRETMLSGRRVFLGAASYAKDPENFTIFLRVHNSCVQGVMPLLLGILYAEDAPPVEVRLSEEKLFALTFAQGERDRVQEILNVIEKELRLQKVSAADKDLPHARKLPGSSYFSYRENKWRLIEADMIVVMLGSDMEKRKESGYVWEEELRDAENAYNPFGREDPYQDLEIEAAS